MNKIYVNSDIPSDYVYIGNFTNTYFDLYNTNNPQGQTVTYYRVYYSYDDNFSLPYVATFSNYQSYNYPMIERTDSIFQSIGNYKYFTISFIVIFFMVFICNIVSSIFKRGGLFSGS